MCVLSWTYSYGNCMWVTVHYACCCLTAICFMSFALCYVLINYLMFNYSFHACFLVSYDLLSIMRVLCFSIVLCIVSPHVYSCLFSICVQFYRPLPLAGNPVTVNAYRINFPVQLLGTVNKKTEQHV